MQTFMVAAVLLGLLCVMAEGAVQTETVAYQAGDTALRGYLAYDDAAAGKRAGVLVFPEWWGLNDYPKERARLLAGMGYVALAADMYGNGLAATDPTEAGKLAGQFRANWENGGRTLMRERAQAALAALAKDPRVDPERLGAIGFCFGGTCVLELAYSAPELTAAVTFHGSLTAPEPADLPRIKAHFLILHGADDPTVKPEAIIALQEGLRQAKADWEMIYYGGAVHGFSNPANDASPNHAIVAYNAEAARRSWETMREFFTEVLAKA
jgi:dienelactone hydrolase